RNVDAHPFHRSLAAGGMPRGQRTILRRPDQRRTIVNILTVNLILNTLVFWIAARLYLLPRLHEIEPRAVLLPILLLHSSRHLGLRCLAPGAVDPGIAPQFAYPAAFGDLIAAVLALAAIPAVAARARIASILVWIFNVEGSVDLISAIVLALLYDASPL